MKQITRCEFGGGLSEVHLNSNVIGKGEGKSKKEAEQQAAKEALELMGR